MMRAIKIAAGSTSPHQVTRKTPGHQIETQVTNLVKGRGHQF